MTPENAKALLPIITAYAEGKVIQFKTVAGEWANLDMNHLWASVTRELRIKSEPKQVLMTADDLPQIFWVRHVTKSQVHHSYLVTVIDHVGNLRYDGSCLIEPNDYPGFEWSADRKTWNSFMKEVQE